MNYLLTQLGARLRRATRGCCEPLSFFFVATVIVVWMSVPFVAFTVYAALTQLPEELSRPRRSTGPAPGSVPARHAADDPPGAAGGRRCCRSIWDLRVFTQIYILQKAGGSDPGHQPARHLHLPARIGGGDSACPPRSRSSCSLLTVVLTAPYVRAMLRRRPSHEPPAPAPRAAGSSPTLVGAARLPGRAASPSTGWSTAPSSTATRSATRCRPGCRSAATSTTTARVFDTDQFVNALKVSLMVTRADHRGRAASSRSSRPSRCRASGSAVGYPSSSTLLVIQMIPVEGLFISQYKMLETMELLNTVAGLTIVYVAGVLPFTIWTLRGFVAGVPVRAGGGRDDRRLLPHPGVLPRSPSRCSPPAWSRPASSASSRRGTSSPSPLVVMTREDQRTLPLWLTTFTDVNRGTDWGGIMAGSTLIADPRHHLLPRRPGPDGQRA